jgi:chemotaxis protein MotB
MSGSEKTVVQTIIKRKIRNPEEPQENGGWKVAYADFVTAMMAFFMVMWLLSSANEDQRRGIAGYFRPSSDLNRAETGSLSMVDKGILHGGDTLDAAVEAKLESVEAQSSSADEPHQNATQKDLKAIKTLFSDLYKEKLGRPPIRGPNRPSPQR